MHGHSWYLLTLTFRDSWILLIQFTQRIQFQEEKRQSNIETVVRHAASELEDKHVEDHEPDHDWTARFFNDVQDVSTKENAAGYMPRS